MSDGRLPGSVLPAPVSSAPINNVVLTNFTTRSNSIPPLEVRVEEIPPWKELKSVKGFHYKEKTNPFHFRKSLSFPK